MSRMRGEEMKKPLPYRWQADDPFLGTLNDAQDLAYRRLMDSCWLNWGIPKEMAELATICRFSPAKDFEKAVWFKLEEKFCAWHGKFQSVYLDQERERLAGISAAQSKRAKRPRKKPPANGRLAPGKPAVKEEKIVFGPIQPTASPRITPGIPAAKKLTEIQEALASDIAAGEPPASPRLIIEEEKILPIPAPEPDKENAVITENVSRETTPDKFMDQQTVWEDFCEGYPEPNLLANGVARETFFKTVINDFWLNRVYRAGQSYLRHLIDSKDKAIPFTEWFGQWKAWEDPAPGNEVKQKEK